MRYVATVGDRQYTIELDPDGHAPRVTLDGREVAVDWRLIGADRLHVATPGDVRADQLSVLVGERSYDVFVRAVEAGEGEAGASAHSLEVLVDGLPHAVSVQDARAQALASLAAGHRVSGDATGRAPMPGLVSNVLVAEGAQVERGQTVVVLEAMKMENDLPAPRAGLVKAVRVGKGQTVNQNDVLIVVGDPDEGAESPADDGEL
jgi:biotin carboxyl carrier protein